MAALRKGNAAVARSEIAAARKLVEVEPLLACAGLSEEKFAELDQTVNTMPAAATQVLKYATISPFSALGIPRLQAARTLNTVNKRGILKNYRKLAMQLHPDKCDHALANDAMQALNGAYDKIDPKPDPTKGNKKPAPGRRPGARR